MSRSAVVPAPAKGPKGRQKSKTRKSRLPSEGTTHGTLQEILMIAEQRGLLAGSRTHVVRGRMPVGLVEQAKLKSGISSLANLAVSDDYAQWLLAQRATVNPELDLEF